MNKTGKIAFSIVIVLGISWAIFGENPIVKVISIIVILGAILTWIIPLSIDWLKKRFKRSK